MTAAITPPRCIRHRRRSASLAPTTPMDKHRPGAVGDARPYKRIPAGISASSSEGGRGVDVRFFARKKHKTVDLLCKITKNRHSKYDYLYEIAKTPILSIDIYSKSEYNIRTPSEGSNSSTVWQNQLNIFEKEKCIMKMNKKGFTLM
ncbi:MAG: hypothetical protein MJ083_06065, partial [Clostridia bacterium]|nr:hypothetical protein [Clostridia bacterium]